MNAPLNAPVYDLTGKRVLVAGAAGMVGAALVRRLSALPCTVIGVTRADADLTRQAETEQLLRRLQPHVVIVAAAKVGGIHANAAYPAQFAADNMAIALNLIHGAHAVRAEKLLFLGSSCIYPKHAPQPMREEDLLTGPLEPTNQWYAVAKIAGLKLCEAYRAQYGDDFIAAMPTNLYGPGDNYHPENGHVIAALLRRFHEAAERGAREVQVWGSGAPRREFLHVDDLADACLCLLERWSAAGFVNVGSGHETTIAELAQIVARLTGFRGDIVFDPSKPDGAPRKLVDGSRLAALGWRPKIALQDGLRNAYADFLARAAGRRAAE